MKTVKAIKVPAIAQQTDSHCGPAVLQSLLHCLGRSFTQDQIVTAARNRSTIMAHGTRPDHIARAVETLTPRFEFWFKQHATGEDIATLLHEYDCPVAINWQGLFYDSVEEEQKYNPKGDHGHYSIVTAIDVKRDRITIADPYSEYVGKPRTFSFEWFKTRWWDVDRVKNKKTGKKSTIKTKNFIFIVTKKKDAFPLELGMKRREELKELKG